MRLDFNFNDIIQHMCSQVVCTLLCTINPY